MKYLYNFHHGHEGPQSGVIVLDCRVFPPVGQLPRCDRRRPGGGTRKGVGGSGATGEPRPPSSTVPAALDPRLRSGDERSGSLVPSERPARIDRARLPAYVGTPAARWESGYPSDCKSAYTGSNPVRASSPSPSGSDAAIRARIRVCSAVAQW